MPLGSTRLAIAGAGSLAFEGYLSPVQPSAARRRYYGRPALYGASDHCCERVTRGCDQCTAATLWRVWPRRKAWHLATTKQGKPSSVQAARIRALEAENAELKAKVQSRPKPS